MASPGRWASSLKAETPAAEAARQVLGERINAVVRWLGKAIKFESGTPKSIEAVHELRVASRRAVATLEAFTGLLEAPAAKKLRRRLRRLRDAAGVARDCDVQQAGLRKAEGATREELGEVLAALRKRRVKGHKELIRASSKHTPDKLARDAVRAAGRSGDPLGGADAQSPRLVADVARDAVRSGVLRLRRAVEAGLTDAERLHRARVRLKRLRYTFELFASCAARGERERIHNEFIAAQDALGKVNDAAVLLASFQQSIAFSGKAKAAGRSPAARLVAQHRRHLAGATRELGKVWPPERWAGLLDGVLRAFGLGDLSSENAGGGSGAARATGRSVASTTMVEPKPARSSKGADAEVHRNGSAKGLASNRRLAAVDVGTNSVRLIVAEASPGGSYRVLDDEKEITRLGRGLAKTGKMDAAAIEHTIVAVERMVSIARGYGADRVRIVGTSAAREAANASRLRELIAERVGIDLEIISGQQEAMLAFMSAANAFNLADGPGLVVDIGGGSTELVLSGPGKAIAGRPAHGVVEHIWSVPIGAVRLTEQFGGPEASAGKRYKAMRRRIEAALKAGVGKPRLRPVVVVGTGGTITTLAAMVMSREIGSAGDGLFGASVQGREITRADLRHTLDYLRKMPLKDRVHVPGLPADRADIIVAGLTIADVVLKRFKVNAVKVHEGGIRDGLLLAMVREMAEARGKVGGGVRDPMASIRRFARACNYERAHSEHVTSLALRIFDQLQQAGTQGRFRGPSLTDEARALLEAAGVVHDVGYLISYSAHHKHSYHLVVHADLPGWTTRQVQIIANVARYHRGAEPKSRHTPFSVLTEGDRVLVRALGAILRIADGLDRPHIQRVRGVGVRVVDDAAHISCDAPDEPSVELWGAARKGSLFENVFGLTPHFEWRRSAAAEVAPGVSEPVLAGRR